MITEVFSVLTKLMACSVSTYSPLLIVCMCGAGAARQSRWYEMDDKCDIVKPFKFVVKHFKLNTTELCRFSSCKVLSNADAIKYSWQVRVVNRLSGITYFAAFTCLILGAKNRLSWHMCCETKILSAHFPTSFYAVFWRTESAVVEMDKKHVFVVTKLIWSWVNIRTMQKKC